MSAPSLSYMTVFRVILLVLAIVQVPLAIFTAMVGAFADGGDIWSRLVLIVLHPLCAVALLVLVVWPKPPAAMAYAVAAMLACNIVADVTIALLIATEVMKGDWPLPLVFSIIPFVGLVYSLTIATSREQGSRTKTAA